MLLDAAAFVPANRLDLSAVRPEFVAVSWYKVFGYPTGVGALLVRRDALPRLRRPWFSGGTIWGVSVQGGWHRMLEDEGAFEDGTLNFLSIPDVTTGLDWIDGIGIDLIHRRVTMLTGWLLDSLGRAQARQRRAAGPACTARPACPAAAAPWRSTSSTPARAGGRRARGRAGRGRGGHLAAHRVLLQPGRRRVGLRARPAGRARPVVARAGGGGFLRRRITHGRRLPGDHRPADRRRRPGVARRSRPTSPTWRRSWTSPSAPTATASPTAGRTGAAATLLRAASRPDGGGYRAAPATAFLRATMAIVAARNATVKPPRIGQSTATGRANVPRRRRAAAARAASGRPPTAGPPRGCGRAPRTPTGSTSRS